MSTGRHVAEKDADLTILHLSGRSAILHANASRFVTSFGKAAFINDQDGRLLAELLQDVLAQIITHQIGIPDRLGKQAVHAIRSSFSGMFSQLPSILAFDGTEDALQIGQRPPTRFRSRKTRRNAGMQTRERLCPTADFAGGRPRSTWGGMLVMLHDLLLLAVMLEALLFSSSMSHRQEDVHEVLCCSATPYCWGKKCNCSALLRSASLRLASLRLAPLSIASLRLASHKLAP